MNALHAVALAVSLSFVGIAAGAQVESQCLAAQLKASGALAAAKAACAAKAVAKGNATDGVCLAKSLQKATNALAKAEKKGDCLLTGRTDRVAERAPAARIPYSAARWNRGASPARRSTSRSARASSAEPSRAASVRRRGVRVRSRRASRANGRPAALT
jgi:hypothetical protein